MLSARTSQPQNMESSLSATIRPSTARVYSGPQSHSKIILPEALMVDPRLQTTKVSGNRHKQEVDRLFGTGKR